MTPPFFHKVLRLIKLEKNGATVAKLPGITKIDNYLIGFVVVQKDKKYGIINEDGNFIVDAEYL